MGPDLTKAGLDAHIKQIRFPPPIDRSIHKLTIDGCYTGKVDIDVRNRFGNILKGLQLKMTIGKAY